VLPLQLCAEAHAWDKLPLEVEARLQAKVFFLLLMRLLSQLRNLLLQCSVR
jgi:hypothetical protein